MQTMVPGNMRTIVYMYSFYIKKAPDDGPSPSLEALSADQKFRRLL